MVEQADHGLGERGREAVERARWPRRAAPRGAVPRRTAAPARQPHSRTPSTHARGQPGQGAARSTPAVGSATTTKSARAADSSNAHAASARESRRPDHQAASGRAKSRVVTNSGCTSRSDPRPSAAAWAALPARSPKVPTHQSGRRRSTRSGRGRGCARRAPAGRRVAGRRPRRRRARATSASPAATNVIGPMITHRRRGGHRDQHVVARRHVIGVLALVAFVAAIRLRRLPGCRDRAVRGALRGGGGQRRQRALRVLPHGRRGVRRGRAGREQPGAGRAGRRARSGARGRSCRSTIPGTRSGFAARTAQAYLPPIWFARDRPKLPVVMLLHGTPGAPTDWTDGGLAPATADAWAAQRGGVAPVLVMPDINGSLDGDSECSTARGATSRPT